MVRLVANKRLRYPHGRDGKEYGPGDSFETSERDAKALTAVRVADYASGDVPEPRPARRRGRPPKNITVAMQPAPPAPQKVESASSAHPDDQDDTGRQTYRRRDMTPEDPN